MDFILKRYSPIFLKFFKINFILSLSVQCVRWWFKKLYAALLRKLQIKQGALLKKIANKIPIILRETCSKICLKTYRMSLCSLIFLESCLWHAHFGKLFLRDGHCTTCQEIFSTRTFRNRQLQGSEVRNKKPCKDNIYLLDLFTFKIWDLNN